MIKTEAIKREEEEIPGVSETDTLKKEEPKRNSEVENFNDVLKDTFDRDLKLFSESLISKIPEIYIERHVYDYTNKRFIHESELKEFRHCILKGDLGIGKTVALSKMAIDFKKENPHFLVRFIELGRISSCFSYKCGSSKFTSEDEAKQFLIKNLLNFGNQIELLINYYLSMEEPPVLLIFDGFDEIMPDYTNIVFDLIDKLRSFNIKILVSVRFQCAEILENLKDFNVTALTYFNNDKIEEYLRGYFIKKNYQRQQDLLKRFKSCFEIEKLKDFVKKPLFLRMIADIFLKEYEREEHNLKISEIEFNREIDLYRTTIKQSFDLDEEGIDEKMKRARYIYTLFAFKELNFPESILEELYFPYANFEGKQDSDLHKFDLQAAILSNPNIIGRGIIQKRNDGSLCFVDRSFAEYFCALELNKEILKCDDNIIKEIVDFVKRPNLQLHKFTIQILKRKISIVEKLEREASLKELRRSPQKRSMRSSLIEDAKMDLSYKRQRL